MSDQLVSRDDTSTPARKAMQSKPHGSNKSGSSDGATQAEKYVLGDGHVGEVVARGLRAEGYSVALVNESYDDPALPGRQGDPADLQTLKDAGVADASTVIVAAQRDRRNLLIAQLVSAHFDVPRILVLVNSPDRSGPIAEAGHEPVCATSALSDALVSTL